MLSGILVVACGLALIGLAVTSVLRPPLAERILAWFASSARAHHTEQVLRLVAGAALVIFSRSMWAPHLFRLFGWLLVVTAAVLLLMPWRWHHAFSTWAVPLAIRHLRLYALGAFALGALILYGASRAVLP